MTPEMIPFEPWHLTAILGREEIANDLETVRLFGMAQDYLRQGPAYSIVTDEDILWCGGMLILWPGVAEAWAVPSLSALDYPVTVHRLIYRMVDRVKESLHLRRIQCSVVHGYKQSRKWVKMFGFCFEGKMRNYGPDGETHYRYAWVRE
jgi:hypothetical protein